MTERKIDEYQKAAINSVINSVVSAGAGSGKTTVLSERFLNLLTIHPEWKVEEILTLTFTKKATVEMSSRIYKVLKEKAPEKAKDFYKANIKTLDSYCNSVAKMGCRFYGIAPDFTEDEETIVSQIKAKALPYVLEHRDNPGIKALVQTENYETFAEDLFVKPILYSSTIAEPLDFDALLGKQFDEVISRWEENTEKLESGLNQLIDEFNGFDGNTETKFYQNMRTLLAENNIPDSVEINTEDIWNADYEPMEKYLQGISKILGVSLQGNVKGASFSIMKEIIKELREQRDFSASLVNYVYGFKFVKELLPLLKEFQNIINNIKRTSGCLTFADISSMALCILRDHPEIRQIEKNKYKAIMIDEFQDNNSMQRDMLFLLAEKKDVLSKGVPEVENLNPEKLFFVGDEKQSIYRFRGGDVSVFRALSKDLKDGNLTMSINYRSNQALIGAFNAFFGGIKYPAGEITTGQDEDKEIVEANLPSIFYNEKDEEKNSIPDYEAVYHEVHLSEKAGKEVLENKNDLSKLYSPKVHIAVYEKSQSEDASRDELTGEEAEAEWVAQKIAYLVNEKKVNPNEIAILMRTYALQPLYERCLLNHNVPYDSEKVMGFYSDGPVNDIFTFLRLVAYPFETNSYAQVLRSPFVNLSIPEMEAVISFVNKKLEENPDYMVFSDEEIQIIEKESVERFWHAQEFFNRVRECAREMEISKLVSMLWYEGGYRYETMWNRTVEMYSKHYDLMFEMARNADNNKMNLASFVDSLEEYKSESGRLEDMDIPLEQNAGVHIMSIFKSKGLEFEVVFVVGTHKLGRRDRNSDAAYCSKEFGITLNTPSYPGGSSKDNYFYKKVKDLNSAQSSAELRRIAYVALTRAKKELYVTAGEYSAKADAVSKYAPGEKVETILQVLYPAITFYTDEKNAACSPFDFEIIPVMQRSYGETAGKRRNTVEEKNKLINLLDETEVYEKTQVVEKESIPDKYARPSQLHVCDDESGKATAEDISDAPFQEINRLVEDSRVKNESGESGEPRFGYNDFGTVVHSYMEALVKGEKFALSNKLLENLGNTENDIKVIENICARMGKTFVSTELGQKALAADWKKAEYEFRCLVQCKDCKKILKGTIDLIYKNEDGTYTIVDYKTNGKIKPEIYFEQLTCYRYAISQMLNIKDSSTIKCYLHYLRYGKSVDVTKYCDEIKVEEILEKLSGPEAVEI